MIGGIHLIWYVLIMFFTGFLLGRFIKSEWIKKYKIIMILTMLLLFSLGLEIGANDELFEQIDTIFLYGSLIALFGSFGSFFVGYILEKAGKAGTKK